MECIHCGEPVIPCPVVECKVRCLHERPHLPVKPVSCLGWLGWLHDDRWHFCKQGGTPDHLRAEPRRENADVC